MKTSDQINDLAIALAKAQAMMKPAEKNAINPHFKSSYADLNSVFETIRGPLSDNGLAILQEATSVNGAVAVSTRILHASGQWIEFEPLIMPVAKASAHGVGSAISYAKRYSISAALGIVAHDDDDGNAASQKETLSKDQVNMIERAVDGDQSLLDHILKHYKVKYLNQIPANQFQTISNTIKARAAS